MMQVRLNVDNSMLLICLFCCVAIVFQGKIDDAMSALCTALNAAVIRIIVFLFVVVIYSVQSCFRKTCLASISTNRTNGY
jgi:hypothetical protein